MGDDDPNVLRVGRAGIAVMEETVIAEDGSHTRYHIQATGQQPECLHLEDVEDVLTYLRVYLTGRPSK